MVGMGGIFQMSHDLFPRWKILISWGRNPRVDCLLYISQNRKLSLFLSRVNYTPSETMAVLGLVHLCIHLNQQPESLLHVNGM